MLDIQLGWIVLLLNLDGAFEEMLLRPRFPDYSFIATKTCAAQYRHNDFKIVTFDGLPRCFVTETAEEQSCVIAFTG